MESVFVEASLWSRCCVKFVVTLCCGIVVVESFVLESLLVKSLFVESLLWNFWCGHFAVEPVLLDPCLWNG